MGVTCTLYGASDREIEALCRAPETIHEFLAAAVPVQRPGCWGRFIGRKPRLLPPTRPCLDLDKTWGAVHFTLTGTREKAPLPLGFLTSGGNDVGAEDVGYGPARFFYAGQVRQIAGALEPLDGPAFRQRIDAKRMRPLHVSGAPPTDKPEDARYLVNDYEQLRAFLLERALRSEGIVIEYG